MASSGSTLESIMDETTMSPTTSTPATAGTSVGSGSSFLDKAPYILLGLAVLVGVVVYFLPNILNALSLPEQIVEEEVKKEVDKKKFDKSFLKSQVDEEIVDKAGVLEEQGYCYIGTDRGVRSCIDVVPGDKCMSGQIFPRRDICVNPSLRL